MDISFRCPHQEFSFLRKICATHSILSTLIFFSGSRLLDYYKTITISNPSDVYVSYALAPFFEFNKNLLLYYSHLLDLG